MLSNGFAIPININTIPSKHFRHFLLVVHAFAGFVLFMSFGLPLWLRICTTVGVLGGCVYQLRRHVARSKLEWTCNIEDDWRCSEDGFQQKWRLFAVRTIGNWFVTFCLCNEHGQKHDMLLFCDQIDEQNFRRLRVYLRFAQVDATSPGDTI